jgi:hypothetical protein
MAFFEIRTAIAINVVIILATLPLSGFFLLMGIANLIHPEVSDAYLSQNTLMCLLICLIGMVLLLVAIAAFLGILNKKMGTTEDNKTK